MCVSIMLSSAMFAAQFWISLSLVILNVASVTGPAIYLVFVF